MAQRHLCRYADAALVLSGAGVTSQPHLSSPPSLMLQRFQLTQFRNYHEQTFAPGQSLSVVVGENGSGKTSLLEGIYLLATGRSFRTSKLANVVEGGHDACTLFAEINVDGHPHRVGLSRNKQAVLDARIDGQRINGLSQIARMMPVQVLHPGTVQLIEGGPGERRRFLDWLMFHVEPEFIGHWQRLKEAVSQRNSLLKAGRLNTREMGVWDRQVAENSARIDQLRRAYLPELQRVFQDLLIGFDGALGAVSLALHSGWSEGISIEDALLSHRDQDVRRGFTSVGAHRADLMLKSQKGQVKEVFSRGQQKVVAYALVTAQISLLNELANRRCLVLVDDLTSELDQSNEQRILSTVLSTGNQLVVTTLDERIALPYLTADSTKTFHVEHGVLKLVQ